MVRRILVLAIVAFFIAGTFSAMAGEQGKACADKNALQCMYDWCKGLGKTCEGKSASTCCKTCGTQCCSTCNTDCGGKCCSACKKK